MSTQTGNIHAEHAHPHGGGPAVYLRNLIVLLILTVITVAAAGINFGSGNVVIALFIASVKAILVALFFMHLRYEKPVNAIIAMAGFLSLGLFLMFDFIDVGARVPLQPRNVTPLEQATPPVQTVGPNMPQPKVALPSKNPAPAAEEHK